MAGIKITDLPSLTTAANDDLLYIVDVSTDTSKKIEVGNILSAPTLEAVLLNGNDANGNDINMGTNSIVVSGNAKLQQGSINNDYDGGISLVCTAEKEMQWENGVRYLRPIGGTNVYGESLDNVDPSKPYDNTKSWAIGSRYKNLVTGIEYICTSAVTNDAQWSPLSGIWSPVATPSGGSIQNVTFSQSYFSVVGDIVNCSIYGFADFNFVTFFNGFIELDVAYLPIQTTTFYPIGFGTMQENVRITILDETKIRFQSSNNTLNSNASFVLQFTYQIN